MQLSKVLLMSMLAAAVAGCGGSSAPAPAPAVAPPPAAQRAAAGVLFYANHLNEAESRVLTHPSIVGALFQIYWSEIEPAPGDYRWSQLDANLQRWRGAGKKVALRIMWSSSGYWPDPAAKRPTPQWVWDAGARHAYHAASGTEIPLFWDPIYQRHARAFLDAVAARFDGDVDVLFIDATPGAETNPYRSGTIDQLDPGFREVFVGTAASDGTYYSDDLWWATLRSYIGTLKARFATLPVLVTLNSGALAGQPSRLQQVGDLAVASGLRVGQNGLKGSSYTDAGSRTNWLRWGNQTGVFFEMASATGATEGTMQEVVDACIRVSCDFLNVYATDVLKATPGITGYDPAWAAALGAAAAALGR